MTRGLPAPVKVETGGTNVYKPSNMDGAAKQVQMLKQLTGGKKLKKGGSDKIIVQQNPNANPSMNAINKNLMQIAGQANANARFDAHGGSRRRTKKTKRSRKRSKKTRRRR
jgi:hypothetical protein